MELIVEINIQNRSTFTLVKYPHRIDSTLMYVVTHDFTYLGVTVQQIVFFFVYRNPVFSILKDMQHDDSVLIQMDVLLEVGQYFNLLCEVLVIF